MDCVGCVRLVRIRCILSHVLLGWMQAAISQSVCASHLGRGAVSAKDAYQNTTQKGASVEDVVRGVQQLWGFVAGDRTAPIHCWRRVRVGGQLHTPLLLVGDIFAHVLTGYLWQPLPVS